MEKTKLNELDVGILLNLEYDSHLTLLQLSKLLGRTPEAISYRIHKLQESGVLLRCHAITDMSKLGYETYRVYIKWQNMTLREKESFYDFLSRVSSVWTVAKLHGKWDIAFFIGCKKTTELQKTWLLIEESYKQKIADYKIAIYSPIHNFNKRFLNSQFHKIIERSTGSHEIISYDELDEKIIAEYGRNVRESYLEISRRCNVSIETVRKRIKRLEIEKIIVGYKIDLDLAKLGFQGYRVDLYLNSVKRNKELFEYIKNHSYFYQINESIGGADFETEIVVRSLVELLEILEELTYKFRDVIRYYEYFGYTGFPTLSMVPD